MKTHTVTVVPLARAHSNSMPSALQEIGAGTFAGVVDALVVHPIDAVKTQAQLRRGAQGSANMVSILRSTLREGGVRRLYRGVLPVILRPTAVAMYSGNEWCKRLVVGPGQELNVATAAVAGGLSGVLEAAVVTPYEVVKIRMMSSDHLGRYNSSLHAAKTIVQQEGVLALTSGFSSTCLRNSPFNAIYFAIIYSAKNRLPHPSSPRDALLQNGVLGCFAGGFATAFIAPFDVVKSRMQNQRKGGEAEYTNAVQALGRIARAEGIGALYRGFTPLLVKVVASCGVSFAAFQFALDWTSRS